MAQRKTPDRMTTQHASIVSTHRPEQVSPRITVSPGEWRFVVVVIVALLAVTALPYLYGYWSAPVGWRYMGIMANVPDHIQYFSWYWDYTRANLAIDRLTPEPNAPVFFNLLWWVLGRVGGVLGLDYPVMFQVLRLVATTAFLLLLYRMCALFLTDVWQRRTAFLVATLAGGFGWVLIVLREVLQLPQLIWGTPEYPMTIGLLLYVFEPNTFYTVLSTPHLVGAALYMLAFDLVLRGESNQPWRMAILAGLWAQFMGWQHGYDLFLVWGILGAYGLLKLIRDRALGMRAIPWRLVWMGVIVIGLSAPAGLYSFLLTQLDPIWRKVLGQFGNAGVYSPPLWSVWVLMGPAFVLALAQQVRMGLFRLRGLDDRALFLKAWFWANFALIYLPTDFQVKMLNGWQVPSAILATQFVFETVVPWLQRRFPNRARIHPRLAAVALLAVVVPTNLYLFAWRFVDLGRHTYPYYLRDDDVAALNWLRDNGTGNDVVLASLAVGQYVPAVSGERAVIAHWAQTVDFYTKRDEVTAFYAVDTPAATREALLDKYNVRYVIIGPVERGLDPVEVAPERLGDAETSPVDDWSAQHLDLVFVTPTVTIFQVRR